LARSSPDTSCPFTAYDGLNVEREPSDVSHCPVSVISTVAVEAPKWASYDPSSANVSLSQDAFSGGELHVPRRHGSWSDESAGEPGGEPGSVSTAGGLGAAEPSGPESSLTLIPHPASAAATAVAATVVTNLVRVAVIAVSLFLWLWSLLVETVAVVHVSKVLIVVPVWRHRVSDLSPHRWLRSIEVDGPS